MLNLTEHPGNMTSNRGLIVALKICVVTPMICVFLYFIALMLHTLASHRQFWESPRYLLFGYMLINDALLMVCSVLLFLFFLAELRLSISLCVPLLIVSTTTFLNTPLILATMSLERYVAIFYPLHRPSAWRADRIWAVVLPSLLLSFILPTADFGMGRQYPGTSAFTTLVHCKTSALNSSRLQVLVKVSLYGFLFMAVALVILFTYVRILLEARKVRRDRASSVGKALRTVLLHGLQLLLCLMAFMQPMTEHAIVLPVRWLREQMSFLSYYFFALLPRFLSPLIYGLRDEILMAHMRRAVLCCSTKVIPGATGKL
ncbi:hypothetical protein AAFF_G00079390 [Aldrovandia affinis]|uniref:G-protein coupled receptors family 1 profile domain-containing protein n=1 Tax=Aldrovandia affinis TaxID=143900 RepID=A0AAD7RXS8_9TELE|nr:hypothetical protein AAFF_G00079390 [Aldrovandia affinis]